MTVLYVDLEEKSQPAFANSQSLVPANQSQNAPQQQQQQSVQAQLNAQVQATQRGASFQMGMASL